MAEETLEYQYGTGVPMVVKPPASAIFDSLVEEIRYKGQLIARNQKLDSGVAAGIKGFAIGFLLAAIMVGLPLLIEGGA